MINILENVYQRGCRRWRFLNYSATIRDLVAGIAILLDPLSPPEWQAAPTHSVLRLKIFRLDFRREKFDRKFATREYFRPKITYTCVYGMSIFIALSPFVLSAIKHLISPSLLRIEQNDLRDYSFRGDTVPVASLVLNNSVFRDRLFLFSKATDGVFSTRVRYK